jgi:hypothetical protein
MVRVPPPRGKLRPDFTIGYQCTRIAASGIREGQTAIGPPAKKGLEMTPTVPKNVPKKWGKPGRCYPKFTPSQTFMP